MSTRTFFAPHALLASNWAQNVLLEWDAQGRFTRVQANANCPAGVARAHGPVVPSTPNVHSQSFMRVFAGLGEVREPRLANEDTFHSWQKLMLRVANVLTPEMVETIATLAYIEMLEAGYTNVCEFHVVHHDEQGRPYTDDTEMCQALIAAAQNADIGLTLLPALYQSTTYGQGPPGVEHRRLIRGAESMQRLLARLINVCGANDAKLGLGLYSLRNVPKQALHDVLSGADALDPMMPVHIAVAQRKADVDDCIAWSGDRPMQWLLDHADVNEQWCLLHATHMSDQEALESASTGAVIGVCPSTEANLGGGLFKGSSWIGNRGRYAIGSGSNTMINAANELRQFEYTQRLRSGERNVMSHMNGSPHIGTAMTIAAVTGGAQASGRDIAGIHLGQTADWIELNALHPSIANLPSPAAMLDAHIFSGDGLATIGNVVRKGRVITHRGKHSGRDAAQRKFIAMRKVLMQSLA